MIAGVLLGTLGSDEPADLTKDAWAGGWGLGDGAGAVIKKESHHSIRTSVAA
jgi:hypothetical protein